MVQKHRLAHAWLLIASFFASAFVLPVATRAQTTSIPPTGTIAASTGAQYTPTKFRIAMAPGTTYQDGIRWTNMSNDPENLTAGVQYLSVNSDNDLVTVPDQLSPTSSIGQTITFDLPILAVPAHTEQTIGFSLTVPSTISYGDYLLGLGLVITATSLPKHTIIVPILIHVRDQATVAQLTTTGDLPSLDQTAAAALRSTLQADMTNPVVVGYRLRTIAAPRLALRHLWQTIGFENTGTAALNAPAIITYRTGQGQLLGEQTVVARLLMPKTNRTMRVEAPSLWVETGLGRLPYMGPVAIEAHSRGVQPTVVQTITWLIPWWMLALVLLAGFGLLSRVTAYRPRAPHRPYLLRYQGRLSLTVLALAFVSFQFFSHAHPVSADIPPPTIITHTINVVSVAGYQMLDQGSTLAVALWTNQPLQLNTPDKIYLINLGPQAPISVPKGTPLTLIGQL